MLEPGYNELPFVEKLAMMMTDSYNELMNEIYGSYFHACVRACVIEASSDDCLRFFLPSNGIEVGCHDVGIKDVRRLDESDVLRHIDEQLAIEGANNDYEEDQRHPMQKAIFLAKRGEKRYFFAPLAYSDDWFEGTFFCKVSDAFCQAWTKAINDNAELLESDPELDKASERAVNIHELVSTVCNSIITHRKTEKPWDGLDFCCLLNQIAALRYEQNDCKGSLVFFDGQDSIPEEVYTVRFAEPIKIATSMARSIRKLLELTDSRYGLIVDIERYNILGVTTLEAHSSYVNLGNDTWYYASNGTIQFKAVSGKYMLSQTLDDVMQVATDIPEQWLESVEKVKAILRMATEQHRGTGLVFSSVARQEAERLASCNRCILVDEVDLSTNKELFLLLSSIDGALFFSADGKCHGIGAILDGQATTIGTLERGARYNSLYNYIAWKKDIAPQEKYFVVVVSEDETCDATHTDAIDLESNRPSI